MRKVRGGRKGGRDGGGSRLLRIEEEEGKMLNTDDDEVVDLLDGKKHEWENGERFCLNAEFCMNMGPEDDYARRGKLVRLIVEIITICLCFGCFGQHYFYKK